MTAIKRHCLAKVEHFLEHFPAVLILGVRQCGKTVLARQLRPKWQYFDLARAQEAEWISRDYDFFFHEHGDQIIFDEAQLRPELFRHLRGVIDAQRDKKNRFILTGSSSPHLIQAASDSLAGRIGVLELGTFKFSEMQQQALSPFYKIFNQPLCEDSLQFLKHELKNCPPCDVLQFCLQGGYPEPRLSKKKNFFDSWMENYYQTYINRDIKTLYPRLDNIKYQRFVKLLSDMSGTIINRAHMGRALDINTASLRDYLDIANNTYMWRRVPAYAHSQEKSLIKMSKGLMCDSGLCNFLSNIVTRQQLLQSIKLGTYFEAFVIEEILKGLQASFIGHWSYYYYRTKNGAEIDLILEGPFGVLPIEIKVTRHIHTKQLWALKEFVDRYDLPLALVVNNSTEIKMLAPRVLQIPAYCI